MCGQTGLFLQGRVLHAIHICLGEKYLPCEQAAEMYSRFWLNPSCIVQSSSEHKPWHSYTHTDLLRDTLEYPEAISRSENVQKILSLTQWRVQCSAIVNCSWPRLFGLFPGDPPGQTSLRLCRAGGENVWTWGRRIRFSDWCYQIPAVYQRIERTDLSYLCP